MLAVELMSRFTRNDLFHLQFYYAGRYPNVNIAIMQETYISNT